MKILNNLYFRYNNDFIIVYYGGRLFPKFLSFYFTAAHRSLKTHYNTITYIQPYDNTNRQFIIAPTICRGGPPCPPVK